MKIAMLNPPYPLPGDPSRWITVPPQGYGGVQWVVANLIDGLIAEGCDVTLLGAPGSPSTTGLSVADVTDRDGVEEWLMDNYVDIIHDHTNGELLPAQFAGRSCATFHLTGVPRRRTNCVYVSEAQRVGASSTMAPVIRLPVNTNRYRFTNRKQDYLLFLGRVSRHKGVHAAAAFAAAAGLPLRVAGPSWAPDYLSTLTAGYAQTIDFLGPVGGSERLDLLAHARAILVMSQPVPGPNGDVWSEPGATVVSEAAASGTPTIATANGCLPEIVPGVGQVLAIRSIDEITPALAVRTLSALPEPDEVRAAARDRWHHRRIARQYLCAYERVQMGQTWS